MGDMGDDFRILRKMTEEMREQRLDRFNENILSELRKTYTVEDKDYGTRIIVYGTKYGTITIYPKANNLLIHNKNKWHKPAVKWVINNIFNNKV